MVMKRAPEKEADWYTWSWRALGVSVETDLGIQDSRETGCTPPLSNPFSQCVCSPKTIMVTSSPPRELH